MAMESIKHAAIGFDKIGSSISPSGKAGGDHFSIPEFVKESTDQVNQEIIHADKMSEEFMVEGKHELHEVMISLEKADLSFRYLMQVRNKVLDAYNEVMRMQV